MIDRIFAAALTFCVLAGGTVAIGTELFRTPAPIAATMPTVLLPAVEVIGKRAEHAAALASNDATEPALRKQQ